MGLSASEYNNIVSIDKNHIDLIAAFIATQKSRRLLELGYGSGLSTKAILASIAYNAVPVTYDIVDNWSDNEGKPWANPELLSPYIKFYNMTEEEFIKKCTMTYDFILSDADHRNSDKWFPSVYNNFLLKNGIMVCHDITQNEFPNLFNIYKTCVKYKIPHTLFNKSTLQSERCDRGLLIIYKTDGVAPVGIPARCA